MIICPHCKTEIKEPWDYGHTVEDDSTDGIYSYRLECECPYCSKIFYYFEKYEKTDETVTELDETESPKCPHCYTELPETHYKTGIRIEHDFVNDQCWERYECKCPVCKKKYHTDVYYDLYEIKLIKKEV